MTEPSCLLACALEYDEWGFKLHPLSNIHSTKQSPGKKPMLTGWQNRTANTKEELNKWFATDDLHNMGLVCGKASNVIVVDIDHKLFADELFAGINIDTLRAKRTDGRGHIYFRYNPDIKAAKYHDFGIEILSDGNNAVLPPSKHISGDTYKWIDKSVPIAEFPIKLIENIEALKKTQIRVNALVKACRPCFNKIWKDKPDLHGADGREMMLAFCTELKANGATLNDIVFVAKLIYKTDFDITRTTTEFNNIDGSKTWKCETLEENLSKFIDCAPCKEKKKVAEFIDNKYCSDCEYFQDGTSTAGHWTRCKHPSKSKAPFNVNGPCEHWTATRKAATVDITPNTVTDIKDKYPSHILEMANKILDSGDPFNFILDRWNEKHVGDTLLGQVALFSVLSTYCTNTKGIHPKPSGKSGSGKSDALNSMLFLLPEDKYISGSLSSKALFYDDSLKPGCIVCSDDQKLTEDLIDTIKQSTSKYQIKTSHRTVKKQEKQHFIIPERVTFWLAGVDGLDDEQMGNRFINVDADETPEQDERVFQKQVEEELTLSNEDIADDGVLVCRAIFDLLGEHTFNIKIPFSKEIKWYNKNNRRNFPMFKDMVRSAALFKHRQGRTFNGTVLTTVDDFRDAKHIYQQIGERNATNLTDTELKLMRWLEKERKVELKDIQKKMGMSSTSARYLMHGRDPNVPGGILAKVPGVTVQQVSNTIREDDKESNTTKRNFYVCETSVFGLDSYSDVVGIDETMAESMFSAAVDSLTSLTPESHGNHMGITLYKNKKSLLEDIVNKNIENNKKKYIALSQQHTKHTKSDKKNISKSHFPTKNQKAPTDGESGMCEGCDSGVREETASGALFESSNGGHDASQLKLVNELVVFKKANYPKLIKIEGDRFFQEFLEVNYHWKNDATRVQATIDHLNLVGWV